MPASVARRPAYSSSHSHSQLDSSSLAEELLELLDDELELLDDELELLEGGGSLELEELLGGGSDDELVGGGTDDDDILTLPNPPTPLSKCAGGTFGGLCRQS